MNALTPQPAPAEHPGPVWRTTTKNGPASNGLDGYTPQTDRGTPPPRTGPVVPYTDTGIADPFSNPRGWYARRLESGQQIAPQTADSLNQTPVVRISRSALAELAEYYYVSQPTAPVYSSPVGGGSGAMLTGTAITTINAREDAGAGQSAGKIREIDRCGNSGVGPSLPELHACAGEVLQHAVDVAIGEKFPARSRRSRRRARACKRPSGEVVRRGRKLASVGGTGSCS